MATVRPFSFRPFMLRPFTLLAGALCAIAAPLAAPSSVDAQEYLLQMPVHAVSPGDPFAIPIEGDWVAPVKGFQLAIQYPSDAPILDIGITVENSLVGELEPEFIQFNLEPGEIVGGVLFEILIPFEGIVLPSVGFPLLIAEITGSTPADVEEQVVPFSFVDGIGTPATNNTFVVEFDSIPPSLVTNGALDIRHPPVPVDPIFLRGDVNDNGGVDIADAVFHLNYTFGNGPIPTCLDAGDANDDGHSDISDAVFILLFLFNDGPAMNPPYPTPGVDPTPDTIGCESGVPAD